MTRARYDIHPLIGFVTMPSRMRAAVLTPGVFTGTRTVAADANAHALAQGNAP